MNIQPIPFGELTLREKIKQAPTAAGGIILALGIAFIVLIPAALAYMAIEFVWANLRRRKPHSKYACHERKWRTS